MRAVGAAVFRACLTPPCACLTLPAAVCWCLAFSGRTEGALVLWYRDEKTTDSTTGVGKSIEEDEYSQFLLSPSLRIAQKIAKSVGSASSTIIKKAKVNLGAFHYLVPLARSKKENCTTLKELKH